MAKPYELIWISPILSQQETEVLFHWVDGHLRDCQLEPLGSLAKVQFEFLADPAEAIKINFKVRGQNVPHAFDLFKEAIWSELLAKIQPVTFPYAVSFQALAQLMTPKQLVCFDMDSTLINEEVIDEIARSRGLHKEVSEITELAMQGKLDFRSSLTKRVKLFTGMPQAEAQAIIPSLTLSPGAEKLLLSLRSKGIRTVVVSGGFEMILRHFRKLLFLDQAYGNILLTDENELLTGQLDEPIVDADYKRTLVSQMKENYGSSLTETVTVGDGANDIPMMGVAGVSVSFCGKPKLAAHVNTLIFDRNLLWINPLI